MKFDWKSKVNIFYLVLISLVLLSNIFSVNSEHLLLLKPNIRTFDGVQVHFVDVGQGDSIVVTLPDDKVMIIDSGTKEHKKKLDYYLNKVVLRKDKIIDYLVLTHPDSDHSSNMQYLIEKYEVKKFYRPKLFEKYEKQTPFVDNPIYRDLLKTIENRKVESEIINSQVIKTDSYEIKFMTVLEQVSDIDALESNNFSPLIKITGGDKSILLTGDVGEEMEELYINKYGNILDTDILKLAHHGSKYSSTMRFLDATSPSYAVTCVGVNNYGHPANETLLRLLEYDKDNNSKLYDTFLNTLEDGNIIYSLDKVIGIDTIANIDDYNFVSYWVYSSILAIFLIYLMMRKYLKEWQKDYRFKVQNAKYKKLKNNNEKNSA